jgi:DNA recombination protein RmuC
MMRQTASRLDSSAERTEAKLEAIKLTVEGKLAVMQQENGKKLDEMRATVDEKLEKTLQERIGQSFRLVSERLEQVYKGLGEMKTLAIGVGDLKKVLSNVKTRGVLGEVQLGAILSEILSSEQYKANIATKRGSQCVVEYAVKLPGNDDGSVWLPIDAKFPADAYSQLVDAYDRGDAQAIDAAGMALDRRIRLFAKEIHDKYIDTPYTTDFAVMFLPFEGLYAEVARRGLFEILQRDYKITVAGPTTMAAFLNSLQMGFRTLAIQKRSGEVWEVLGAVKTEFDKFGGVLSAAQQKLAQANSELDKLVGVRTRQIQRRLSSVASLPEESSALIIEDATIEAEEDSKDMPL